MSVTNRTPQQAAIVAREYDGLPSSALITLPHLCRYLGIHPDTLKKWRGQKTAPRATKIGARVYFAKRDVDEWILRQAEKTGRRA